MQHWKSIPKALSPLPLKRFMKSIHFHPHQGHCLHLGHNLHSPSHECPVRGHTLHLFLVVVVHSLSHDRCFVTPWTAACQTSLSFTISQSLLKLIFIES